MSKDKGYIYISYQKGLMLIVYINSCDSRNTSDTFQFRFSSLRYSQYPKIKVIFIFHTGKEGKATRQKRSHQARKERTRSNQLVTGVRKVWGTQETDTWAEINEVIKKCAGSMRSSYSIEKRLIRKESLGKLWFTLKAK